jgi:hypothetical protein
MDSIFTTFKLVSQFPVKSSYIAFHENPLILNHKQTDRWTDGLKCSPHKSSYLYFLKKTAKIVYGKVLMLF